MIVRFEAPQIHQERVLWRQMPNEWLAGHVFGGDLWTRAGLAPSIFCATTHLIAIAPVSTSRLTTRREEVS